MRTDMLTKGMAMAHKANRDMLEQSDRQQAARERAGLIRFVQLVANYRVAAFAASPEQQRSALAIEARALLAKLDR